MLLFFFFHHTRRIERKTIHFKTRQSTTYTRHGSYDDVTTFTYTGSDQTYSILEGTTSLRVRMWGAGGGSGSGGHGGSGGYTESTITLPHGTTMLRVVVGEGGNPGEDTSDTYGGGG